MALHMLHINGPRAAKLSTPSRLPYLVSVYFLPAATRAMPVSRMGSSPSIFFASSSINSFNRVRSSSEKSCNCLTYIRHTSLASVAMASWTN